jgi:aspartate dehydrogenase
MVLAVVQQGESEMALSVGLIGCGSIGAAVLAALDGGAIGDVACDAILVRQPREAGSVDRRLTTDIAPFLDAGPNLVVDCAGQAALREHGAEVLSRGRDLMTVSMGAFFDDALHRDLVRLAEANGAKLLLLSGAVGALDLLGAAAEGGLDSVEMAIEAPWTTLHGTPAAETLDLAALTATTTVFRGTAREGARHYPHTANIAAAVALAGLGLDETILEVRAKPDEDGYVVTLAATGAFGRFRLEEEMKLDPRTRTKVAPLVSWAVLKSIRQYAATVKMGR